MELIQEFKNYLLSQKNAASPATVKNYIADVKKFIVWFEQANNSSFNPQLITVKVLGDFKSIKSKELSASSLDRHISSLKKFFTFLKLEGHMSQSPFELIAQATPVKTDPYHLKEFKDFLYVYNASHLTIKNYLIDVKQFFMWLEKVALTEDSYLLSDKNLLHKINDDLIQEYSDRLLQEGTFSPSTINRKLSSLRKYLSWASSQGLLTDGITVLPGNVKLSEVQTQAQGWQEGRDSRQGGLSESEGALAGGNSLTGPQAVETHFENQIHDAIPNQTEDVEENTNSAYSSFAPIRLSQKISRGFSLLLDVALVVPVAQLIAALQHRIWILRGKPLFTISSPKLKVLQTPLALTGTKVKNISKSFYNPLGISITHFPWYKKFAFHLQYTRPKWYKRYHRLPVSRYFNWAILIVFCTMIGFGLYSSFFSNARKNQTLAALPTAPPRVLSFQGRLTDNNDNPITTANTHLRFAIYDDTSATGSGHLLWQEVDTVSPDTDGDFSTLLGDGSSCGSPLTPATGPCQIPSTLFSQNASLYLGVTVEWTPELAPRQRLATVAYAANSETLQGLPPITAAGAGTQNVVLALDSSGNLAIGASTTFQSTSGQFSLSGNTIAINTNPGSNGNITLSPDGSGLVDVQKPLQNSTLNNNIPSAAGAVEVDDLFAILATSSGQSALTINQNSTGPLISASTSGVAKFTVDNAGDVFAAGNITGGTLFAGNGTTYYINNNTSNLNSLTLTGNLNVSGNVTSSLIPDSTLRDLGSVTNYWGNVYATNIISPGSGVSGYWQRNSGAVSPANITDDVLVGGVSTASAKFQIFGTTGNATSTGTFTFTGANPTIQTTSMLPLVIGSSSTGSIQLSPNGTTGLYVSASGNVGIGTTNPIQALSVNGTVLVTTSGGGIELTSNSGFTRYSLKYGTDGILGGSNDLTLTNREINGALRLATSGSLGGSSGETTRLYITSAGFVGIGSTSFGNAQLVVNQTNTSGAGDIFSASTSGVTKFTIQNNGTASTSGNLVFAGTNPTINTTNMNPLTIGSASTGPIQLSPKGTTGLYVDGTGNVGIGTTNPSSFILQTAGSIGPTATNTYDLGSLALQWNNVYANNIFQNGTAITQLWQLNQGALAPLNTSNDLLLGGNSTTSAVFGFTNVAAGTPTATISGNFSLQVPSGNSAAEKINLLNNTTLGIYTSPGGDSGLSANPAIFVNNSGNVGIGTNNPSTAQLLIGQKADVNIAGGTGYAININSGSNTILKIGENSTSGALVQSSSSLPLLLNANGNNVGIATTNPSVFKLQIAGHTGPDANNTYDLGASTQQWRNIYGQHVFANGVEVTQMWQENLGALSPLNITDDLLLGATSTTSARFAVTNIAGGTPTASLSAGTNSGTYITADGTLATRSKQTLALGSQSSTGNITLGSDATARNITIGNTTGATGLTLQTGTGNFSLDGVAGSTYAIGASTIGGTITIGGASQTGTLTLGQSTAGENINIGSAANSAAQQIQIGNGASTANSEVDILSGAGTSGTSTLALANNPRVGTIDIGNVTSTVIRTFTIAGGNDANNDTVNILTGNPSNGTQTINLLTGNATGGTQTLNLATGTSAKAINIGGTGANTIALGNTQTGGSISLGAAMTTGTISLGGTGLQTGSITIGNGTGNQTIDLGNGSGNKTIDIGGSGTNTLNIGSSQTNGNINIGNATSTTTIKGTNFTTGGVAYATSNTLNFTSSGSSGQCLLSNALSAPTWGLCTFGNGNYWNLQQGALFPINATVDFLVGADNGASSSAKFAALNLASGTPTASVSSGLNGTGMSIDANGNIQTANKMTLTLGGNKTGNIVLKPNNGASGTITFSGYSTGVLHSVSGLITSSQVDLQNDITSTLKVDHGGTGLTSLASGSLIYGSGGGTANSLAIGNTNDMLVTLGGVPTWSPYATLSALFVTNNTQLNTISSANNTILPTTNGTLNLGDGAHFFGTIYANNIIAPVGSGTSGFWQLAADVLAPVNTIYDLAVGGSATGSATPWQVFGTTVGVDTAGTATSSGNLAFRGASTEIDLLNGTGLNIKASVGGDAGLTSVLNISNLGNVTIAGTLAVNGNTLSTATSSTFSLLNGTLSTLNFAQGTSTLTIGTGGTTSTTINGNVTLGDNTALRTINFGGEVGTDIIPNSNNSHDLGSSSNFWRNIYTNNTFANAVTGTQGYWQLNSNVISPAYNWQDLGIGGTGTSSAKFQVFGSQFATDFGTVLAGTASTSGGLTFRGGATNINLLNNTSLSFNNSVGGDKGITSSTPVLYLASTGTIGIGTTNPLFTAQSGSAYNPKLTIINTVGNDTTRNVGLYADVSLNNTTSLSGNKYGILGSVEIPATNAQNDTSSIRASQGWIYANGTGIIADARGGYFTTQNLNTGTISAAFGTTSEIENDNGTITSALGAGIEILNGASMTTAYGLSIGGPGVSWNNTGTVGTSYGLYLDPSIDVGTTRYAMYSSSTSNSYFAGNVGIGTTSPVGLINVNGALIGKALAVFNQTGNQDILTASASGIPEFTIASDGSIKNSLIPNITDTYNLGSDPTVLGGREWNTIYARQVITPSGALGSNFWQLNNSVISPAFLADDLTIGGLATSSATFHVFGQSGNQGTLAVASISAHTSFAGFVLDNTIGDLFTASSSGLDRFVIKQSGNVGIGVDNPTNTLQIAGDFQVGKDPTAWGVSGYSYRRQVTINQTNGNTTQLNNYQVKLVISTASLISAGKMRSDCNDIRFTDLDGSTNLNYWIETGCNTNHTTIWVKVPTIGYASKNIYMYYGNSGASAGSSSASTFVRSISNVNNAYRLDEPTYDPIQDYSTNNNVATASGTTVVTGSSAKFNNARSFNGTSDYITASASSSLNIAAPVSLALWFKTTTTNNSVLAIQQSNSGTNVRFGMSINRTTTGKIDAYANIGGTSNLITTSTSYNDGNWHFAVLTLSGNTGSLTLYVDGAVAGAAGSNPIATITGTYSAPNGPFDIGAQSPTGVNGVTSRGSYYNGSIDEVRYYSISLSAAQITDLYGNGGGNYGYVTPNNAGTELVAAYTATPPSTYLNPEQNSLQTIPSFYVQNSTGNVALGTLSVASTSARLTVAGDIKSGLLDTTPWGVSTSAASFQYRARVLVDNTKSSTALTNYIVQLTTNTAAPITDQKMRTDCGDIRFTDGDGTTNLNYWIETGTCNSSTTKINVKVPTIPSGASKYIYMYYGDPSKTTVTGPGTGTGIFNSTITNVQGAWRMDETSGTTVADYSGNSNTGLATSSAILIGGGVANNARRFNGVGQMVYLGKTTSLQITGALSLEAWVRTNAAPAFGGIIGKLGFGSGQYQYVIRENASGKAEFGISNDGTTFTSVAGTTALNDGSWHHLVGVYTPSTSLKIYVDGALQNTNSTSIPASLFNSPSGVAIGCTYPSGNGECFNGDIDEARVYNQSLQATDVSNLYNSRVGYGYVTTNSANTEYTRTFNNPEPVTTVDTEQDPSQVDPTLYVSNEFNRIGINTANPTATLEIGGTYATNISNSLGILVDPTQTTVDTNFDAGIQSNPVLSANAGTQTGWQGISTSPTISGNASVSNLYGLVSLPTLSGSGTVSTAYAQYDRIQNNGIGTISNAYGVYVAAPSGSGTITNKYAFVSEASAGNVGIGSTSPTQALDVNGNIQVGELLDQQNNSYFLDPAGSTTSLVVAGNVGIGTTNPVAGLNVTNPTASNTIIADALVQSSGIFDAASGKTPTVSGGSLNLGGPTYRGDGADWQFTATGQTMTIDLGAATEIDFISFGTVWRADQTNTPNGFTISYSDDNVTYTTLTTVSSFTGADWQYATNGSTHRYWRLTINAFQAGHPTGPGYIQGFQLLSRYFSALSGDGSSLWGQNPNISSNNIFTRTTGNVGIGTTTPHSLLSLGTSAPNGTPAISVYDDGTQFMGFGAGTNEFRIFGAASGTNHISFGKYGSSTWTEQMRLDNNGNVGIGTTGPNSNLHVYQDADVWHMRIGGASGELRIGGQTGSGAVINSYSPSGSVRELYIQRDGGNIGIGQGSTQNTVGGTGISFQNNGSPLTWGAGPYSAIYDNAQLHIWTDDNMYFDVGGSAASPTNRMYINSSGNVGIGQTLPAAELAITGAGQATNSFSTTGNMGGALLLGDTGASGNNGGALVFAAGTQSWKFAAIKGLVTNGSNNSQGDISFETRTNSTDSTLSEKFRIASSGQEYQIGLRGSAGNVYICGAAGSETTFNGTGCGPSLAKYKMNVTNFTNALSEVMQLRPVTFNWNPATYTPYSPSELNERQVGMIAEEVQAVDPLFAGYSYDANGNNKTLTNVDYAKLSVLAISAIQQLVASTSATAVQVATNSALLTNLNLTTTGDIAITDATPAADFTVPHYYQLSDAFGAPITQMGTLLEMVVGNLRAGSIQAQQTITNSLAVATNNVSIAGQSLHDYIVNVVDQVLQTTGNPGTSSPIAEVDQIHTNLVSPLASDSAIAIDLQNSKVSVKNTTTGQTVASIDNTGNATFSGTVNSQNLAVNGDATISGTLHVNQIQANSIAGLQEVVGTLSAQTVNNVTNIYFASPSSTTTGENNTPGSGNSGNNYNGVLTDSGGYANIASFSAYLSYVPNLNATTGMFSDGLISLGPTALTDTTISGTLTIGNQLILADNTINVLGQDVQIQPLRQGGIAFAGGQVHIDSDGNLNVYGKAMFNSDLAARIISPLSGEDLTINLPSDSNHQSSFVIQNASSSAVFSVNQLGDLVASGEATIAKLNLNIAQPAFAISSTEVVATGSAGTAAIGAHQTELTIDNVHVTSNSLIYITPVGQSLQTPYLLRQVPGKSFTVGIQSSQLIQTPFNWLIVN